MSSTIPVVSEEYVERLRVRESSSWPDVWRLLDQVKDPEIPVVSIWDIGILQDVVEEDGQLTIVITPTYSGCPAVREIEQDICRVLEVNGYTSVEVKSRFAPAWSTDWMSPEGREKMRAYGIAPPASVSGRAPVCPQCGAATTQRISEFGSTACKALYRCEDCLEPFDYFKCI